MELVSAWMAFRPKNRWYDALERAMISEPLRIRVWGPWACFTRPEFHVERVSYPVITPSAARGILEAILMQPIEKPESRQRSNKVGFRWHVLRIGIVRKGTLVPIMRNELGYSAHGFEGYDIASVRAQRSTLLLKDVDYLIEGAIEVDGKSKDPDEAMPLAKYQGMFTRRSKNGQCYHRPYLGCREFACNFDWASDKEPIDERGGRLTEPFGPMLRDFEFEDVWNHWQSGPRPTAWLRNGRTVSPTPRAFHAEAVDGWIEVAKLLEEGATRRVVYR